MNLGFALLVYLLFSSDSNRTAFLKMILAAPNRSS